MFNFFKKKKKDKEAGCINIATSITATDSALKSTNEASQIFKKPEQYERSLYDNGMSTKFKKEAFSSDKPIYDPYNGERLYNIGTDKLKEMFGENWAYHAPETDHKIALKSLHGEMKDNPWISNEDISDIGNSKFNLQLVSRNANNAKRDRSIEGFLKDEEYLKKTGNNVSDDRRKELYKESQKTKAQKNFKVVSKMTKNIVKTGHNAGMDGVKASVGMSGTMSSILNITAYLKGEKSTEDAISDIVIDTGKSAVNGYVMSGGLTVINHTLSNPSSKFMQALKAYNVPNNVLTALTVTGDVLGKYGRGEITTQECLVQIGEKGLNFATARYFMAVGQALIPIGVVGAAVGALVGSMITSDYYNSLMKKLRLKELEHKERLRIIQECEVAKKQIQNYRYELELYLQSYFAEYEDCFDEALSEIRISFQLGDADGMIAGANKITRKLGGNVYYDTVDEFSEFLKSDVTDIL